MADDASAALGAPQLAGTLVNPSGLTQKMTAGVVGRELAGLAGSVAVGASIGDPYAGAPDVPEFGRVGYIAVSESEIALVKTKTGAFKMKVTDEVLARVGRSELTGSELQEGHLLSHLRLRFRDGRVWEFDIPKMSKNTAKSVVAALGGNLT